MNISIPTVLSRVVLVASIALYATSLFSPAFTHDRGVVSGMEALESGWFPAIFGIAAIPGTLLGGHFEIPYFGAFSWFANPMMLVLWISLLMKFRPIAVLSGIAALCMSTLFVFLDEIPIPEGQTMMHVHAGAGCHYWMGSMVLGLIAALLLTSVEKKTVARRIAK